MLTSFLSLFPAAFPVLALAHFLALLSPGPDFFLLTGYAVRHRFRGSVFLSVGIAAGNAVYITLAIAGWSGFRSIPLLYKGMELGGAVFLIWMGVMLYRSGRQAGQLPEQVPAHPVQACEDTAGEPPGEPSGEPSGEPLGQEPGQVLAHRHGGGQRELVLSSTPALSLCAQLATGFASAILNPKNALFYLSLMTVILGPEVRFIQQVVAGVWMALVVLVWDLALVALISLPGMHRRLQAKIPLLEKAAGIVLIVTAVGIVLSSLV